MIPTEELQLLYEFLDQEAETTLPSESPVYCRNCNKLISSERVGTEPALCSRCRRSPRTAGEGNVVASLTSLGPTGSRVNLLRDFDAEGSFAFGAGLSKDGEGSERFVVSFGDQKGFAGVGFLPNLADLDFFDGHNTNVDTFPEAVNTASPV